LLQSLRALAAGRLLDQRQQIIGLAEIAHG
jgi:hypothetical protein